MQFTSGALINWIGENPLIALWMGVSALMYFIINLFSQKKEAQSSGRKKNILHELIKPLVLIGIMGSFYSFTSIHLSNFSKLFGPFTESGSLSNQKWLEESKLYGRVYTQYDLEVSQYVSREVEETYFSSDSPDSEIFKTTTIFEPVNQNCVDKFRGTIAVNLDTNTPETEDSFRTFSLSANYQYKITNPLPEPLHVQYNFPLSVYNTLLFENIEVLSNNREPVAWQFVDGGIYWEGTLNPHETQNIKVKFSAKGMDGVAFVVPEPKEINDFKLVMILDTRDFYSYTNPGTESIDAYYFQFENKYKMVWEMQNVILAPELSIFFIQKWPYAPFHEMTAVLPYVPEAFVYFLALAVITSLIFNKPLNLSTVLIMAGLFIFPSLILMAGGIPTFQLVPPGELAMFLVKTLPVFSLVSLVLAFFFLKKHPRLPLILILFLMAAFMMAYPFIGLLSNQRQINSTTSIVQFGMIAYLFGITLFVRIKRRLIL